MLRAINKAFDNICPFSKMVLKLGISISLILMLVTLLLNSYNYFSTDFDFYLHFIVINMAQSAVTLFNIAVLSGILTDYLIKRTNI